MSEPKIHASKVTQYPDDRPVGNVGEELDMVFNPRGVPGEEVTGRLRVDSVEVDPETGIRTTRLRACGSSEFGDAATLALDPKDGQSNES